MLSIEGYIKLILKKRGLTVADLARMMTEQERKHGSSTTVYRTHLNPELKYEDFIVWSYAGYGCNIAIPLNINNLNHINEYYKYTQNWFKL